MIMYESEFCLTLFDEETSVLKVEWKPSTTNMSTEEFKQHLLVFAESAERTSAGGILVDATKMGFSIPQIVQEWHDEVIIPRYSSAGVEKMAFLQPESFIARETTIQTFEEASAAELIQMQLFDDEAEAIQWLWS